MHAVHPTRLASSWTHCSLSCFGCMWVSVCTHAAKWKLVEIISCRIYFRWRNLLKIHPSSGKSISSSFHGTGRRSVCFFLGPSWLSWSGLVALTLYDGSFRQRGADPAACSRVCHLQLELSSLLRITA